MRVTALALPFIAVLLAANVVRAEDTAATPTPTGTSPLAEEEPFVIPEGYRAKNRGEFTVYCRKEPVMGTRLPAEKCYDENGIRALLQEMRETREGLDQLRRICSSQATCGSN